MHGPLLCLSHRGHRHPPTRVSAYSAGSPLDRPKSGDRVYSSPQNIDYFLDIKPTYTHGPEHRAAQDPSHAKADDSNTELVFTGTALTDSPEHAIAQDLSQGGAINNELEDIQTNPAHTNSLEQIAAQDLPQGGAIDNELEPIQTNPAHTNSPEHTAAQDLLQGGAIYNELEVILIQTQPTLTDGGGHEVAQRNNIHGNRVVVIITVY